MTRLRKWLFCGLAVVGALSLVRALYSWLASEAINIPPRRLSSASLQQVSEVAVTLAANLDAPLLSGNRATLLLNGAQIFPAMLSSIRAARESLNLLSNVSWEGDIAIDEVRIATPYFVPDPELELGIAEAARRGVRVALLVPGQYQDSDLLRYASRTCYRRLLEAGVKVYEYQPTMMHTKTVTVDGQWAVIGSSNFDSRSFEPNYEIVLAVFDDPLVDALKVSFANDLADAREISLEDVEQWSWFARVRSHLALLWREQL